MMSRAFLTRALTIFVSAVSLQAMAPAVHAQGVALDGTMPQPLPLFPADNWWNVDVSQAPLDANSASFIAFIGDRRAGSIPTSAAQPAIPATRPRSTACPTSWCPARSRSCR